MESPRPEDRRTVKPTPIVSLRTSVDEVVEMIFRPATGSTRLVTCSHDTEEHERLIIDGEEFVPYSPKNNLLTHRVLLLPSAVGPAVPLDTLLHDIRAFIHRYVDISDAFEEVSAHYVLLTWVYDNFNEVPYLRVRGDYGSGKSRFLLTIGAVCWKPIFASGASTVSPLFRLIDQVGGTLVVDEADFWASDERAEIVKILNNGNARGFPVLRSEVTPQKEFSPRAFNIFGPKVVATRHSFEDEALESRCLTEVVGTRPLRKDIPISLPDAFDDEAEALRNKLLRYRFDHVHLDLVETLGDVVPGLSPRRSQVLQPLLRVALTEASRERMRGFLRKESGSTQAREREVFRQVLLALSEVMNGQTTQPSVGAITERLKARPGGRFAGVSHKWVGAVLRRLGLEPHKSNGVYKVAVSDYDCVAELLRIHGVGDLRDAGDLKQEEQAVKSPRVEA